MTLDDLQEEISIELESMEKVVNEALLLLNDLAGSKPTILISGFRSLLLK